MKYKMIEAARSLGLLKPLDNLSFLARNFVVAQRNQAFLRTHPDFVVPPRHLAFDAYNMIDWQAYNDGGKRHAAFIANLIKERCSEDEQGSLLEWGCGPSRLIRWMPSLFPDWNVVGTDYNPETIDWCKESFSDISFHLNDLMPPLPFAPDTFDAVYNFSVFTHLSAEAQAAWSAELFRVLKPGGTLVATTHGERHRYLLVRQEQRDAFDNGEVVQQQNYEEGKKWYLSIQSPESVRTKLLSAFDDVNQVDALSVGIEQDVWVATKPMDHSPLQ